MTGAHLTGAPAALAAAYAHGPGKHVDVSGRWVAPAEARPTGTPLRELAATGPFGHALVSVLTAALAPRRWEPWADHNDHRAFPSARAAYLHTAALRLAGPDRPLPARRIDPVRGLLVGPEPAGVAAPTQASVEISVDPDRLRPGYGSLRHAVALLEAGHVLGAITEAAAGYGLHAGTRLRAAAGAAAAGLVGGPVATVALRPGGRIGWPRRRLTAVRSGGLAPLGLAADPRPWPSATLTNFVDAAASAPAGCPSRTPFGRSLRHRLLVRGVTGTPDGVYRPHRGGLVRCGPAPDVDGMRALLALPPTAIDIASFPVVWVVTADVAATTAAAGAAGYGHLLLTAGAAAQHVCSAAAETGAICRPVRAVDEAAVEAAVGATAGEDVLYTLLVGTPRLPALGYDLTDPDPGELP